MIYADYNATTPLLPSVQESMKEAFEIWGNPSSTHQIGRKATELLDKHRQSVADALGFPAEDVVFTSGGTEANVMAVVGSFLASKEDFRFLTSAVEHSSVAQSADYIRKQGAKVKYVKLHKNGALDWEYFLAQLDEFKPHLVSLMAANNETGIRFPIGEIAAACQERDILFHTDAVQTFGKALKEEWNQPDFVSVSAHKIYGPKGIGAIAIRKGRTLVNTMPGGSQEIKRRGGTQNMVGICGFGTACLSLPDAKKLKEIQELRDAFENKLLKIEGVSINGFDAPRVPNTSSIRIEGIGADVLLSAFDLAELCISAGSACSSGSISPSRVLLAMGMSNESASESLRISWGMTSTQAEIDKAYDVLSSHVRRIRERRQRKSG